MFTGRDTADEAIRFGSVFPLLLVLLLLLVILIAGRHLASQRPSLVPSTCTLPLCLSLLLALEEGQSY